MTHVEMTYNNNIIIGFKMEGHAGFNTEGPDILCASLSTASQMTINGIIDWIGVNFLDFNDIIVEQSETKAILHVIIPKTLCISNVVQQLFKSFELYVEQLSEQYGDYVMIERREVDDNKDK